MADPKSDLVKSWLLKADHDLRSARLISAALDPLLDVAIYHCQQAAEKTLKALLVQHDVEFERTHDIFEIMDLSIPVCAELVNFKDMAGALTPYAVIYRYPSDEPMPDEAEFNEALATAEQLYAFVLSQLPDHVHPEK